jgi:hypothetical protein
LRTFLLTKEESESLRSQIATLKKGRGEHRKYLPRVFTERGALMAASILSSPKAVDMSIQVVRAFVRLQHRLIGARTDTPAVIRRDMLWRITCPNPNSSGSRADRVRAAPRPPTDGRGWRR